ncbi:SCO family protein [Tahibacter caeni]|uniref:SCO family protein n=1 Tax=Tahibacter caeni TaxID=1453545 RepID=UPI002147AB18|nr:SCO family protein [Tahibacter caeni]
MNFARTAAFALCGSLLLATAAAADTVPTDSVYQLAAGFTDQDGRDFHLADRAGKPQVVALFYTSCRYVCPLIIDSAKAVEHALTPAQRERVAFLIVSMDPARDDPAMLRSVVDKRGLDTQRWTLARTDKGAVRQFASLLDVRYRELADGEFNHTSALVLLDAQGRRIARTERLGGAADAEFVEAVKTAVDAAKD